MAITNSRSNKFLSSLGVAAVLLLTQLFFTTNTALAKEKVTIAIISFSPYAPWYIVKEKGWPIVTPSNRTSPNVESLSTR